MPVSRLAARLRRRRRRLRVNDVESSARASPALSLAGGGGGGGVPGDLSSTLSPPGGLGGSSLALSPFSSPSRVDSSEDGGLAAGEEALDVEVLGEGGASAAQLWRRFEGYPYDMLDF